MDMAAEQGGLETLLTWAEGLGISDSAESDNPKSCLGDSLCVSFFPDAGGRGLGAVRNIRKGELILRVPKSALLTTQSLSKEDEKISNALSRYPCLSPTTKSTVCLLYEMGKANGSRWFPYLMHLPRSYDTISAFGEFEMKALQVDYAIWAVEKAVLKAQMEWKEAKTLMQILAIKGQLQTFKAWRWASATISSRALHIPWDEAGCLCPVGDLFNYAAPGERPFDVEDIEGSVESSSSLSTSSSHHLFAEKSNEDQVDTQLRLTDGGFEEDVAAYCFYARKYYNKGEQVLLSYGTYTNLELLEYYGFLLPENPNDKVYIPLEDEIYSTSSWPRESLYIHQNGQPSFSLLSALRIWATPPHKRRTVRHLAYSGFKLSSDNEIFIMKWISEKCSAVLKTLPSSSEDDCMLLSNICKIQQLQPAEGLDKILTTGEGGIGAFLEANDLNDGGNGTPLYLSRKALKSFYRWKLVVQWRLGYKKTLADCISHCLETIDSLSNFCI